MNYIFFDIECANSLNGEGKICSFGYVKTDGNFNVLKKKDILINPDAPFLLGNAAAGKGIKLAYPLFRFQWAHLFSSYHGEINNILTDKNNLCFAFAGHQDVSYLIYSCYRYKLKQIDFKYFDVQNLDKALFKRMNMSGLDYLVDYYKVNRATLHRSDDDAFMTMEVFREMLKNNNLTVEEVIKRYPDCSFESKTIEKRMREKKKNRIEREAMNKKIQSYYKSLRDNPIQPDLAHFDKFLWKKKIYMSKSVLFYEHDYIFKNTEKIYKHGGVVTENIRDADYIIAYDRKNSFESNLDNMKEGCKVYSFNEFKSVIENLN